MAKVIYYGSVSEVLDCSRLALIYSPDVLREEEIPSYISSTFDKCIYANKIASSIKDQQEFFIDLTTISDRDTFSFNYILLLNNQNKTIAFVLQENTVNTGELQTETIKIILKLTVDTITEDINLDASEIVTDFDLHTKKLVNDRATLKSYITAIKDSSYKPYTSNVLHLHDNLDYIMKYSGSIIKDNKFVEPIEFNITDVIKIINFNEEPLAIEKVSDRLIKLYDQSALRYTVDLNTLPQNELFLDISKDYLFTTSSGKIIIHKFNHNDNDQFILDTNGFTLHSEMRYIIDSLTGETYFYRTGINNGTYGYTVSNNKANTSALEIYCTGSMQHILEDLANNVSRNNNSIIIHPSNMELLEITEGLAIYKEDSSNKCVLHSYFYSPKYYFNVLESFEKEWLLNNRCVLFKDQSHYFLYELVDNNKVFNWVYHDIGINKKFMYNIYKLAKQKYTNTSTELTDLVYKGNVFTIIDNKLTSI